MNILAITKSPAVRHWLAEGVSSFDEPAEINHCDSVDFALRVVQVHDEIHLILVDVDFLGSDIAATIKRLWRACSRAAVVALATAPKAAEMNACVTAGALAYVPPLPGRELGQVLLHVAGGSLWLPDLRSARANSPGPGRLRRK